MDAKILESSIKKVVKRGTDLWSAACEEGMKREPDTKKVEYLRKLARAADFQEASLRVTQMYGDDDI